MTDDPMVGRLRTALSGLPVTEQKMFGGVCFMLNDHMLCGASSRGFMFRVGEQGEAQALARPGSSLMIMGGREMHGFFRVDPAKCDDGALKEWVALACEYVGALPPKDAAKPKKKRGG